MWRAKFVLGEDAGRPCNSVHHLDEVTRAWYHSAPSMPILPPPRVLADHRQRKEQWQELSISAGSSGLSLPQNEIQ